MQKLFQVTVWVCVAVVSIALLGVLFVAAYSVLPLPMVSHSDGIGAVAGGVSERWLRLAFLLAILVSSGFLYWRSRARKSR
ncbi:MAG TPA: hypothetical protein VGD38_05200 [Pyrinomonadaceae bacterium]